MSIYVVDTNFFIQAHRATYPLDVATSFWNKVKKLTKEEKIISIDKVKDEIYQNDDALKQWCIDNLPNNFFKDTTQVMANYAQIVTWAASQSHFYKPAAINEFLHADEADAFLVAFVLNENLERIVVTQEVKQQGRTNKIKIPDPCQAFNIKFINMMDMFRQLNETF